MRKGFFISALVALVLVASATGAERPPFARAYVGTVMGTLRMNGRVDAWKVEGLTFRLQSARFARGRWGGTYLVTGGRVTFTIATTGACTSTKSGAFSLGRLSWDGASISFLQNLREPGYGYEVRVAKEHPVAAAPECADVPGMDDVVSPAGG